MKIKLYTNYAGPGGCMAAGLHNVDEKLAVELAEAGYCEYAEPIPAVFQQKTEPIEIVPAIEQNMIGGRKKVKRGNK